MPSSIRPLRQRALKLVAAAAALTLLAACADAPTAAPASAVSPVAVNAKIAAADAVTAPVSGQPLACALAVADSGTAVIGPRGGVVGAAGSALIVPPGAVPHATAFTFVVPASPFVQIDVHPAGGNHYQFKHPVAISISYARCAPSQLPAVSLGAWWIDPATRDQLGVMAGVDDRQHQRLTFITDHLSGYLVAY